MGILFISHSSRNNEAAIKVRNWLKDQGWGQVFLDLDPVHGLAPGHRWQQELKLAGERCSGVLILISPDWVASRWCQTEFLLADQLGKKVFPLFVAPTPFDDLPVELKGKFQIVDLSMPDKEAIGFEQLCIGLKRAGLDPNSFEWPPANEPQRPIYRGLRSLEEQDAAIFFGRSAQITKGLDMLRRMRDGTPERMLVILGASGAGKSSFLKAGLIARLKRDDENFLVLPVIRPERSALSGDRGLATSLSCDPKSLNGPEDLADAFARLREPAVARIKRIAESAHERYHGKPPTIVIAIDQAEELFAAENSEAPRMLDLLAASISVDANIVLVATIRSDAFEKLQGEPRLADVARLPLDLSPIPHGAFKEVIEGPARLANPPLAIEPTLTERLLKDLAADDALPLLAFTMARLLSMDGCGRTLTLDHYVNEQGGLHGAITGAVESAFAKAARDSTLPNNRVELESLARATFIPALVELDGADAEPRRRVERLSALPESTRAFARHLIGERLLVSARRMIDGTETDTVEVAHEAILRQWPALRSWIAEERGALRALDGVRMAAMEWRAHTAEGQGQSIQSWLNHRGGRLEEAETLVTRPGFANALSKSELEYLAACRKRENTERAAETAKLVREKQSLLRTRRLQRNIGILIAIVATIVLVAGIGVVQLLSGLGAQRSDMLAALAAKESEAGNYDRAARYALAGLSGVNWPFIGYRGAAAETELEGASSASRVLVVLRGHADAVVAAAFSPDGKRIVTASHDKTARIWDANTAREIAVLRGHADAVVAAAFSPDGKRIVTASHDKTARVWDADTAREIAVLRGHDDWVSAAAFSPDGKRIVTASDDKTARIWDANTAREIAVLRGHDSVARSATFSPDGKRIVTASYDKTARIWDANTAREIAVLRGHEEAVVAAAFSPDGKRIVTASHDKTARVWDADTAREIAVLRGHDDWVSAAAFSPDGKHIVTASRDKTARIWDADTAREIAVLRGHDDWVVAAAYGPDGKRIVTASRDKTARIWDANTARKVAVLRGHADAVEISAFSPDGKRIVTASRDKTARIWDANTAREIAVLRGHDDWVFAVAFSPDGKRIVTASADKTARIWDANTAREIAVLRGHEDLVETATFSPDGKRIVTASADKTARIWDANTAREIAVLRGHSDAVETAAFSPDGKRIVTGSDDKTARIWDANTAREIAVLRGHKGTVGAAFSPDGKCIVTASADKTARIWDANTAREIAVLRGHSDAVETAAFSPDGKRIVTASDDRTARIWDANTAREIAVLRGHEGMVVSAVFSPDGRRILTASRDKTARIWSLRLTPPQDYDQLVDSVCSDTLAKGLSVFSSRELSAAPVLDAHYDMDACRPPSLWARFNEIFSAADASPPSGGAR